MRRIPNNLHQKKAAISRGILAGDWDSIISYKYGNTPFWSLERPEPTENIIIDSTIKLNQQPGSIKIFYGPEWCISLLVWNYSSFSSRTRCFLLKREWWIILYIRIAYFTLERNFNMFSLIHIKLIFAISSLVKYDTNFEFFAKFLSSILSSFGQIFK